MDEIATAIQPRQARGRMRFEAVLNESETLLLEEGLKGFSIPALAERLSFTRRSIYKFFPSPYAILNELTLRYLRQLESELMARAEELQQLPVDIMIQTIAEIGTDFYNRNLIARLLILGGPVTDSSYRVQELTVHRLGKLAKALLGSRGIQLPPSPPDVATLAVEISFACFRLSYYQHGTITPEYSAEASYAMQAYISRYINS